MNAQKESGGSGKSRNEMKDIPEQPTGHELCTHIFGIYSNTREIVWSCVKITLFGLRNSAYLLFNFPFIDYYWLALK